MKARVTGRPESVPRSNSKGVVPAQTVTMLKPCACRLSAVGVLILDSSWRSRLGKFLVFVVDRSPKWDGPRFWASH